MNPRKGYQHVLMLANLENDFTLCDIKIFEEQNLAVLYLKRKYRAGRCSQCGTLCSKIHSTDEIKPRDLPISGRQTRLVFDRYTVKCPKCEKAIVEDFWLVRQGRYQFTWRYECQLSRMTEEMPNISVARLEGLNDKTVFNIDFELLQMRIERQQLPNNLGPHYSMDEVYYRYFPKGDARKETSFVTNLVDLTHKRVIFNAPGRSEASATVCLLGLSPEQREQAKSFATDMHDAFHNAIHALCPNAVVVLDRFHIMKLFNETMNDFRKAQVRLTTDEDEQRLLRGTNKWILLTNPENLSHKDRGLLDEVKLLNERVVEALLIREHFVSVFESINVETAKLRWRTLERLVIEADIKEFNKFFADFKKWLPMLWDYFKHKTSSAVIEALNHKIKATKIAAYGYLNLRYFQLKILQRVGFLNSKYAPLPTRRPAYASC